MTILTVDISDDRFAKLREVAKGLLVTPEELVVASIEDLLARPEDDSALRKVVGLGTLCCESDHVRFSFRTVITSAFLSTVPSS